MSGAEMLQTQAAESVQDSASIHNSGTQVLHNSRLFCFCMFVLAAVTLLMGACMALAAGPLVFPLHHLTFGRGLAAAQWLLAGFTMVMSGPAIWRWAAAIAHRKIILDDRGVQFVLGTRQKPIELWMPWEQVASVQQRRTGNTMEFTVQGHDGSYARFTSYSFFRSKRVARLIAERAGLTVQNI